MEGTSEYFFHYAVWWEGRSGINSFLKPCWHNLRYIKGINIQLIVLMSNLGIVIR